MPGDPRFLSAPVAAKWLVPLPVPKKCGFLRLTYIAHAIAIIYTVAAREEQSLCGVTDLG